MNFQHFVLTRINVEDLNLSKNRTKEERNETNFLDYRLGVFKKTCLPSIHCQTNQNFEWLILVDDQIPGRYIDEIKKCCTSIDCDFVRISSKETFLEILVQSIAAKLSKTTSHIITTNLDSDDIAAKDLVANIQHNFKGQNYEFLNFPFGYLYDSKSETLYVREWLTASCHTLVESSSSFHTCLKFRHSEIPKECVRQIITKPMWLMTVHDMNIRTKFDVSAAWQPLSRIEKDFCIDLPVPQQNEFQELYSTGQAVVNTLRSKRHWDTPKVKARKVVNILFPASIRLIRQIKYR